MTKFKGLLGLLMVLLFAVSSCSRVKVPAGHVGVKYHLYGTDKGVNTEELSTGRYIEGYNEEIFVFPTFKQTKTWTSDVREDSPVDEDFNFQSKKGLSLYASVGIEYHIPADKVVFVFEQYKMGVNEITDKVLRNGCREAFNIASSTRTAEEMYGEGKVEFLDEVDSIVRSYALERGIVVDDLFLIGKIGIPESVTKALNLKIEATQKAQQIENELRSEKAQAEKKIEQARGIAESTVIKAKAQAEANRLLSQSLTPTLITYEKIKKWNGIMPTVSGAGMPIINLK